MFDATIGILFLAVLFHRIVMALWGYFDQNCNKKAKEKRAIKKKREAHILYNELVEIVQAKLHETESNY